MVLPEEINGPVLELESLDPYCQDPKIFKEKIRRAIANLDSHKIDSKSNYRRRLKIVEEEAKKALEEKQREDEEWSKPVEKKKSPVLIYRGLLEKSLIRICAYPEGYCLKRFFDKSRNVSFRWKFNPNGRLENLDFMAGRGSDQIVSLTQTIEKPDWKHSQVNTYPIPEKALSFISGFQNNSEHVIYGILIRLGHKSITNLLNDLNSDKILQGDVNKTEITLEKIVKNKDVMNMMRETASICPYMGVDENSKYVLRYEPVNRSRR